MVLCDEVYDDSFGCSDREELPGLVLQIGK